MVRSTPLLRKRIEHKRTARFTRFQSDLYGGRLAASWRRPRGNWLNDAGIDNRMRRRFRGNKPMPKIGYGNDKKTRFHLPNGLRKFVVRNVKDLDVLLMNNRTFCAEIAHNVSARVTFYLISDQSWNQQKSSTTQSHCHQRKKQGQNRIKKSWCLIFVNLFKPFIQFISQI